MPEKTADKNTKPEIRRRYRGRIGQVQIYLGKLLRMFLYQNDWMVLPMAALVAGLVGIVIRWRMFFNMEGTLISSLAVACVCLWNGCFNSIQVICRERDVIKREHRSGMHISSYIVSHMIYQAFLCLLQTGITVYVLMSTGVRFPDHSLFGGSFLPEFFISLFFITYAADMMSLWISALCRTTTTAMTVMPVVLIFQLVFSGGMMSLPARLEPVTDYIISNVGLKLIAAEADYNHLELTSAWNTVASMRSNKLKGSFTVGEAVDLLEDSDNPTIKELREVDVLSGSPLQRKLTVGDIVDQLGADNPDASELRKEEIPYDTTVGDLLKIAGEDKVRSYIVENSSKAAQNPDYDYKQGNIAGYWVTLLLFAAVYALLAMITLEFIDHDKR
jgi:hypothetical protein